MGWSEADFMAASDEFIAGVAVLMREEKQEHDKAKSKKK